jgi:hypothetical protein
MGQYYGEYGTILRRIWDNITANMGQYYGEWDNITANGTILR